MMATISVNANKLTDALQASPALIEGLYGSLIISDVEDTSPY